MAEGLRYCAAKQAVRKRQELPPGRKKILEFVQCVGRFSVATAPVGPFFNSSDTP